MSNPRPFLALWGWPIAMGVLTTTGLITALVSDTWGDWWSWLGLGVPVAVMGWFAWRRPATSATATRHQPTVTDLADTAEPRASARSTSL
ncbi:MAG: hypothetical protein ACK41V_09120 [Acidovorax sp.]|uniref:hypothetical protein n=1 Tax=Acidovorax sp. TaxID=1872122 RepID=UPI00391D42CE